MVMATPRPLYPPGWSRGTPLHRRMGRPRDNLDRCGVNKNLLPLPGFEPRTVKPVANCYTECAIQGHHHHLHHHHNNNNNISLMKLLTKTTITTDKEHYYALRFNETNVTLLKPSILFTMLFAHIFRLVAPSLFIGLKS